MEDAKLTQIDAPTRLCHSGGKDRDGFLASYRLSITYTTSKKIQHKKSKTISKRTYFVLPVITKVFCQLIMTFLDHFKGKISMM